MTKKIAMKSLAPMPQKKTTLLRNLTPKMTPMATMVPNMATTTMVATNLLRNLTQ